MLIFMRHDGGARRGGSENKNAALLPPPPPLAWGRGAEGGADWLGARRPLAGRAPVRRKEVEAADWPGAALAPPSLTTGPPRGAWPRCPSFAPFSAMRRLLQTKGPPEGAAAILGGEPCPPPAPGLSFPVPPRPSSGRMPPAPGRPAPSPCEPPPGAALQGPAASSLPASGGGGEGRPVRGASGPGAPQPAEALAVPTSP